MLEFANIPQSYLSLLWFSISKLNWDFCLFSREKEMCINTMYNNVRCTTMWQNSSVNEC